MRDDFAAFILTHGRPDNIRTIRALERGGYTGALYFVVDDEDGTLPEYLDKYGDRVIVFSKSEIEGSFDAGNNWNERRTITFARNACWVIAERLGVRYFVQLDDDYQNFEYRFDAAGCWSYKGIDGGLDAVFSAMIGFLEGSGALAVAVAQGGDFIGGASAARVQPVLRPWRKAMNTFFCSTARPFTFVGTFNEDVNTYVSLGSRGKLFFTVPVASVVQTRTQSSPGGITEAYLRFGTYVKAFMTVMYAPSSVRIASIGESNQRIHHSVRWRYAVPKILHESIRKPRAEA